MFFEPWKSATGDEGDGCVSELPWLSSKILAPVLVESAYVAGYCRALVRISNSPPDPEWFPLNLAELFTLWFLLVTPVTTAFAVFALLKLKRSARPSSAVTLFSWTIVAISLFLNGYVLLALWASTR